MYTCFGACSVWLWTVISSTVNPATAVVLPRVPHVDRSYLTAEEMGQLDSRPPLLHGVSSNPHRPVCWELGSQSFSRSRGHRYRYRTGPSGSRGRCVSGVVTEPKTAASKAAVPIPESLVAVARREEGGSPWSRRAGLLPLGWQSTLGFQAERCIECIPSQGRSSTCDLPRSATKLGDGTRRGWDSCEDDRLSRAMGVSSDVPR